MEKFRKMLLAGLSILAFSFLAINASAQTTATLIPSTKQIVLDESKPFADTYVIDLSNVSLSTDQAAHAYFQKYESKVYIEFSFDLRNKKAYMTLKQGLVADVDLNAAQWNNILFAINNND